MKKLLIILLAIFVASFFMTCTPPPVNLTITIVGTGTITADGTAVTSGTAIQFPKNESVELVVTPGTNFAFEDWTGTNADDVTGTASPYTIVMDEDKVLTATFVATNAAPTATVQAITGTAQVGQTLTGHYAYADAESDPEGTSTFRWLSSATETGTYTAITGATALTYVLQASDENQYIKFEVTPVATTGTTTGTPVQSAAVGPVISATAITVAAAPTTLFEAFANDGSLDPNLVTLTVANSTFIQAQIILANITATVLPTGLSLANPTYIDTTHATVQVTGNAAAHQNANATSFTITVAAAAINTATASCTTNSIALDFADAPVAPFEDWETNTFTKYPWVLGGAVVPTLTNTQNHTTGGTYSERGGVIGNSQSSYIGINANVPVAGDMTFYFLASSESTTTVTGYDGLRVFVDGTLIDHLDNYDCGGNDTTACTVWTQYTVPLTTGNHQVVFQYRKDVSGAFGDDTVYLDDIEFPLGTTLVAPSNEILVASSISPTVTEVPNGGTVTRPALGQGITTGNTFTMYIINTGANVLELTGTAPDYVTVSGDTALTVTTQPAVASLPFNTYVSFVCTIDTTNTGTFNSTLTIPNNDSDENPYVINVSYSVIPPYSEAEVRNGPFGTTDVVAHNGTYNGGNVIVTAGVTSDITFRMYNVGLQSFNMTGTAPNYVVWASGSTLLSVSTQPTAAEVTAGGYRAFTIRFTGDGTPGTYSATFNIANNETGISAGIGDGIDETNYTFTVTVNASISPILYETFDGATFPPTGWTEELISGTRHWTRSTTTPQAGAGCAFYQYTSTLPASARLFTPAIDFSSLTSNATLSFWMRNPVYSGVVEELHLYYRLGAAGEWTEFSSYTTPNENYVNVSIALPSSAGAAEYYIAFVGVNHDANSLRVDTVMVMGN